MNNSMILGIDPGKHFFAATLLQSTGERIWKGRQFDMSREGFAELQKQVGEGELTVGVEASGRIDANLLAWLGQWRRRRQRKLRLIRVNPGQSARFGGCRPRRDETDGSDSQHIAEYTRVYAHRLESFEQDSRMQTMVRLVAERQQVVEQLTATKNRLHEQLLVCFPEFPRMFKNPFAQLARAVLREVPLARRAAGRKALSLGRVKGGRRGRSLGVQRARQLIQLGQCSIASAGEEFDAEAMIFLLDHMELLEQRLDRLKQTFQAFADQVQEEAVEQSKTGISPARQIQLLTSIPGIAIVSAATLVLGTRGLARFQSGSALAAQWASCPQRIQTGTSLNKTRLTTRGDHQKRTMLYLATQIASITDPALAFHKWRMIQRGLCPQQAVCANMNRLARIIWAIVEHNQPYDTNRMLAQISIHHADLWNSFLAQLSEYSKLWKRIAPEYRKIA